jgi:hypothetical protein
MNSSRQPMLAAAPKDNWFIPRFHSGILWKDFYFMAVVIFIQLALLPRIFPVITTELVTIWLCFYFVLSKPYESFALAIFSAICLETHYGVPSYFYFFIYGLLGLCLVFVRDLISWRNHLPWLVLFGLVFVWIQGNEIMILSLKTLELFLTDWLYYSSLYFYRFVFIMVGGYLIASYQVVSKLESP